jgi:acyl transferase domain-containing protein/acyl carrier protein
LLEEDAPSGEELVNSDPARLHLAIFAASVAAYRVLTADSARRADVVAGHSLGEIAALTAAGAFTVADGARVVAERDVAFERRKPAEGGMLSLSLGLRRTEHLLAALGTWSVEIAAVNAPRQTVVSGPIDELTLIEVTSVPAGIGARWLQAPYPFHNHMLRDVAEEFAKGISRIPVKAPNIRVYSPIALEYHQADADLREAIVSHLVRPVRFSDALHALYADGVDEFVECGARGTLTGLVTDNLPSAGTHAPSRRRTSWTHATTEAPAVPAIEAPVGTQEEAVRGTVLPAGNELLELLRQEYADALGYPPDVFADDADLETDLGVDSLKQAEMFARFRKRFDLPAPSEGKRITAYRTLPAVANGLHELAKPG